MSIGTRLFSGIQPTGIPHIGNYFGAIRHWVTLQNSGKYDKTVYSVVDLHAFTVPQEPEVLRSNIRSMVACLLACGIDTSKSVLFQQSRVSGHCELAWLLGCLTNMSKLNHLPAWKEKSEKMKEVPFGLYAYPVLQAADILLYRATHVPVGDDQVKHIELCRDVAKIFNTRYGFLFPLPKCLIGEFPRVHSLKQPTCKMSKSEPASDSRIDLTDPPDVIREKVKKAMTDSIREITYDPENRPGVSNLVDIYAAFRDISPQEAVKDACGMDKVAFKEAVAEQVIQTLTPIQGEYNRILADPAYIDGVLKLGADQAQQLAEPVLKQVRTLVGFS